MLEQNLESQLKEKEIVVLHVHIEVGDPMVLTANRPANI